MTLLDLTELAVWAGVDELSPVSVSIAEQLVSEVLRRPLWEDGTSHTAEARVVEVDIPTGFDPVVHNFPGDSMLWAPWGRVTVAYLPATPLLSVTGPSNVTRRDSVSVYVGQASGTLVTVTYRGGWTASTVPPSVKSVIAQVAGIVETSGVAPAHQPGLVSASVGDVSESYAPIEGASPGMLDQMMPGAAGLVSPYRFRWL